jgi:hypothetical protein
MKTPNGVSMPMNIQISEVNVREIQREDVPDLRAYFFDSPPEFLNSIGLRTPRPGDADAMIAWLEKRFQQREAGGPPTPILTVIYRGERVGVHTTTHHVPGKSLIMHAHFFRKDLRGKGIGRISYVLALEKFLTEYGYQEVIFKTPIGNVAPMKIK